MWATCGGFDDESADVSSDFRLVLPLGPLTMGRDIMNGTGGAVRRATGLGSWANRRSRDEDLQCEGE